MVMNEDKFELTSRRTPATSSKEQVQDLGVMMCSDETFSHHISHITSIASKLIGWMLRTFHTRDRTCMVTLCKALVFPRLEYCCQR